MSTDVSTTVAEQLDQAAQLSAEQQQELQNEAKKELRAAVTASKKGSSDEAVKQFLTGMHSLRFINIVRKLGHVRSWATDELSRDLSWYWDGKFKPNLVISTYAAIKLLHGDISPVGSGASKKQRDDCAALIDSVPPVGQFHKAYNQLVERIEVDSEESWVLLPGYEDKCVALFKDVVSKKCRIDDTRDGDKVTEKGVMTIVREFMVEYKKYLHELAIIDAGDKQKAKELLEADAKLAEDVATEQQKLVKKLLDDERAATTPEDKAKLQQKVRDEVALLEEQRKELREKSEAANKAAKDLRLAEQQALSTEEKAADAEAKVEKRRVGATAKAEDNGHNLPWQALGENAAANASTKDLAEALYGIVNKHKAPEDVLYAMLVAHRGGDSSNRFKAALAHFRQAWDKIDKAPAIV